MILILGILIGIIYTIGIGFFTAMYDGWFEWSRNRYSSSPFGKSYALASIWIISIWFVGAHFLIRWLIRRFKK